MKKKTLNEDLFCWLEIVQGLDKMQVEHLASSGNIGIVEKAFKAIEEVKVKPHKQNQNETRALFAN